MKYVFLLLISITIGSCKEKTTDLTSSPPLTNTKRVAHLTIRYARVLSAEPGLDTVRIAGVVYPIITTDSLSFHYDALDRLTNADRTQVYVAGTGPAISSGTQKSVFTYTDSQFNELDGATGRHFQYTLDSPQRRVLNRSKSQYSYVEIDTLRQYSTEGILTTVQTGLNRQLFAIEAGDVSRIEQYNIRTGKLNQVTQLTYDSSHDAPLAQFTFLGETSRHALLHKTVLDYSYSDGVHSYEYSYTNEYDKQGRMTRQIEYQQFPTLNEGKPYFWTATDYYYE